MSSPSPSGITSDFEAASKTVIASAASASGVQVTTFWELVDEVTLHFQIIRLAKQIYVWIGSDSAKLGNLYAAAPTRPNNTVSVSSILGGASDNTGSGIARRLVWRDKGSPILESDSLLALKWINNPELSPVLYVDMITEIQKSVMQFNVIIRHIN
ncbi:putative inactive serine/threonine-protein kinase lvsG-like [Hibiscus syriacus]|uniref:Inactive serine/threonine-protein kinase lvsG-like n=1 Tax=Hibiscus syriacus TaxID=106335 RepID=A0A6A3A2A3_HIBSY|nr:putative inactive serine/threonine-protein kinase lvsG-like [Hibiscus syriacus]